MSQLAPEISPSCVAGAASTITWCESPGLRKKSPGCGCAPPLATFVFSVIILVSNRAPVPSARQFAPVVSVTTLLALTVATVFGFVAYLHGVVRLMRVQYLLETIATETRRAIEENFPLVFGLRWTSSLRRRTRHRGACATPGRPGS